MEALKLGDLEQQYYAELFQTCDVDGTGKITAQKASELFRASGLNQDALKQIWELCGAKRLGHFGRSQFYIALKLIAVAQVGLPVKLEVLNAGKDIPMPKFSSNSSKAGDHGDRKRITSDSDGNLGDGKGQASGALPPPPGPKQSHRRSLSGQYRGVVPDSSTSFPLSTQQSTTRDDSPHNSKSPAFSPKESPTTSPSHSAAPKPLPKQHTVPTVYSSAIGTGKDSVLHDTGHVNPASATSNSVGGGGSGGGPGGGGGGGIVNPVLSVTVVGNNNTQMYPMPPAGTHYHNSSNENGNWAMFEDDENHMLIGSGMKKWESSLEPPGVDSSSISSEADSVDDVWTITDEQRDYYIKQFISMQTDLNGVITGPVAKNFFEKSKLPVVELSKIWQLSDLNRDGALSVEEFCIAMHLVVLRRNEIELPDHLPMSLMPYSTLSDEPFAADLPPGSTLKRVTPSPQASQWTANFVPESPGSSGVPSPAHLVSFDYAKPNVDADSKIVHPVAMRMSPDGHPLPPEVFDRDLDMPPPHDRVVGEELMSGPKQLFHSESYPTPPSSDLPSPSHSPGPASSKYSANIQSRPRPIPKKPNAVPLVTRGQLQPPPLSGTPGEDGVIAPGATGSGDPAAASMTYSQGPPTPPPRPHIHSRSLSVDLKSGPLPASMLPPAVPPRVQHKDVQPPPQKLSEPSVIESKHIPKRLIRASIAQHRRSASLGLLKVSIIPAMEMPSDCLSGISPSGLPTEKEAPDSGEDLLDSITKEHLIQPALSQRQMSRDKRDIGMAIRTHKERNAMLTRLNIELNQELQEVMEQRIALEIQLEHLRPFSS